MSKTVRKTFRNVLLQGTWCEHSSRGVAVAITELNLDFIDWVITRCNLAIYLNKADDLDKLSYHRNNLRIYSKSCVSNAMWDKLSIHRCIWLKFLTLTGNSSFCIDGPIIEISTAGVSWRFYEQKTGMMHWTDCIDVNFLRKCISPVQMLIESHKLHS